jgi:hypothetical protein
MPFVFARGADVCSRLLAAARFTITAQKVALLDSRYVTAARLFACKYSSPSDQGCDGPFHYLTSTWLAYRQFFTFLFGEVLLRIPDWASTILTDNIVHLHPVAQSDRLTDSHKQARKQRRTGAHEKQRDERA